MIPEDYSLKHPLSIMKHSGSWNIVFIHSLSLFFDLHEVKFHFLFLNLFRVSQTSPAAVIQNNYGRQGQSEACENGSDLWLEVHLIKIVRMGEQIAFGFLRVFVFEE